MALWVQFARPKYQRRLLINRKNSWDCFDAFGLHDWLLPLLRYSSYCLQHFRHGQPAATKETFCVNTIAFALVWIYGYSDRSTSAVLIPRNITERGNSFMKAVRTYLRFPWHPDGHLKFIEDPCLLIFMSCIETLQWMDDYP